MKPLSNELQECIDNCNACVTATKICIDQRMGEKEIASVIQDFKNKTRQQDKERRRLMAQLDALNTRMQNARIQKVESTLNDDDFQMLKKGTYSQIEQLEERLCKLSGKHKEIRDLLERGLKNLSELDIRYNNGTVEEKREIISSMFPEILYLTEWNIELQE